MCLQVPTTLGKYMFLQASMKFSGLSPHHVNTSTPKKCYLLYFDTPRPADHHSRDIFSLNPSLFLYCIVEYKRSLQHFQLTHVT